MKIAVLSDIHSNIIALRECIAYLERTSCDEYVFLGDYVSDTPYTRETMDCLYDFSARHSCLFLRGNREEYMLEQREAAARHDDPKKWGWNSEEGNLRFAYEQLTEKDFDFFKTLPIVYRYEKEGYPAITFCHGSPASSRERLLPDAQNTGTWLESVDTNCLIGAHTHMPCEWIYHGKRYCNCGSVGMAVGDPGYAQCMILEDMQGDGGAEWNHTFLKIPYDHLRVVRDIRESGLLEGGAWFVNSNIQILLTGIDYSSQLAALAGELAKGAGEQGVADERCWTEAARRLGVPDYRKSSDLPQKRSP